MPSFVSASVFGAFMLLGSAAIADPASDATAQPAPAAAAAQPTSAAATASESDANMVICRERQAATGSRLGASRECHTKREWDARQADNQRMVTQQQQTGLTGNPPGH